MARRRKKYLAIVQFRVYRDLTIRCWSLNVDGSSFLPSHPTPSEAAKPPKPIPFRGVGGGGGGAGGVQIANFDQVPPRVRGFGSLWGRRVPHLSEQDLF